MDNQMEYLRLNAKELVDSGEIKTAGDVSKYFATFEIAAIVDFLINVFKTK